MNPIKKLTGSQESKGTSCCGVDSKQEKETTVETCCGTSNDNQSTCC